MHKSGMGNESTAETIKSLYMIVHFETMLPTDVTNAVNHINDASKSDEHPDNGLSAVFINIPTGKLLVDMARKHADRVSKDFAALEAAASDFQPVLDISISLDNGDKLQEPFKVVSTLVEGLVAFDNVHDSKNSADDTSQRFLKSAKAFSKILPALGSAFMLGEYLPWLQKVDTCLESQEYKSFPRTLTSLETAVDSILARKQLFGASLSMLFAAKKLYVLASSISDVMLSLSNDETKAVEVVKLTKKFDHFMKECSTAMDANADLSGLIKKLLDAFKGLCYSKIETDAQSHIINVAKYFAKVGGIKI